ncbi:hypothetical protein KMZ93_18895 [Bradyrhizobium sediminis]|uniref:Uncharacterized protein n=1 Tax=Bradyrhizobium sediminis TaxID=2840469 RepID=A0A975NW28_9BRAD|nr:hypothetical protein [Bradyrhizobium sediminis]QWG22040.1 hypothetical protein KMZ93_18895 [Bradyrhizobium sediminis]
MNTTPKSANAAPSDDVHLIVARDEEVVIEHHPEDWIAFVLFLGAGLHRLPAVLHPLHPERQPCPGPKKSRVTG